MNPIRKLDTHLVNKIAAGEVVERPLSLVKELTENALDAGATQLTVEIKDGGLSLVRITDNGCGIPADEVSLAFAQHATSKISDIDDLYGIGTLGFRGEALASIASVSQVEMFTKTAGALMGTRIALHGGTVTERTDIACMEGTTLRVANLFFNTPARLKFLKKPPVEAGYVTDFMQRLAMGYPKVAIRYLHNEQTILQTNGNGDLKAIVYPIYGADTAKNLLPVAPDLSDGLVTGFIGKPETAHPNRTRFNFFLNGRYIKSELLRDAVEEAYRTLLPIGKFPVCILQIQVPPQDVDVNVHPTKLEVRFADEADVAQRVTDALRQTLLASDLVPTARKFAIPSGKPEREQIPLSVLPATPARSEDLPPTLPLPFVPPRTSALRDLSPTGSLRLQEDKPATLQPPSPQPPAPPDYQIIGQVFETYWLVVRDNALFLVDQHAAHERIEYEALLSQFAQHKGSQPLIVPLIVPLDPRSQALAMTHQARFESLGFALEASGADAIALTAVPFMFTDWVRTFAECIAMLERADDTNLLTENLRAALVMTACKKAVKAKDVLSEAEGAALIRRLLALENPFTCPHGRPAIVKITQRELEGMFNRT